nr:FkbM family methyltransferase [uncultured Lichenicoccus sp.]
MTPPHDQEERPAAGTAPWLGSFSPVATPADILACFRLLLGRLPNREEWRGHVSRAGERLDTVVGSYVNSLEFSCRSLGAAGKLGSAEQVRLPDFSIYFEADDAAVGQHVRANNYEADVTAVFRRFVRPGAHVLDLGANIGYFTMLSAALVGPSGSVMAIEPNPNNARLVEASRRANGFAHVRVVQVAAGREPGLLVLHRSHSNGTTSVAPDDAASLLAAETVACVRVDGIVPRRRRIGFIKADVEGAEYLALSGCLRIIRRHRPVIVTEFSPSMMPGISGISGLGYLRWLIGLGYRLSIVLPDGGLRAAEPDAIMREHAERGVDHLDLVAEPVAAATRLRRGLGRIAGRLQYRRA